VCWPPGLFAYNLFVMLNKCQFVHYEPSSNYFIQQKSPHLGNNFGQLLTRSGPRWVAPTDLFPSLASITLKNVLVISVLLSEVSRVHNHRSNALDVSIPVCGQKRLFLAECRSCHGDSGCKLTGASYVFCRRLPK
jgi:hypothetical protein